MNAVVFRKVGESSFDDGPGGYDVYVNDVRLHHVSREWEGTYISWYLYGIDPDTGGLQGGHPHRTLTDVRRILTARYT